MMAALCLGVLAGQPVGGLAETSSSTSGRLEPEPTATVERRRFSKGGRVLLKVGAAYLAREDFWISPGVAAEGSYHFDETWGLDLSVTAYASTLDAAARQLRVEQGLLPDAQQPILRAVVGPRWAFAYGKVLLEALGTVVHFDAALSARLGVMVTNETVNPGGEINLAVQAWVEPAFLIWGEGGAWVGYEDRNTSVLSGGPRGVLGFGVRL